MAAQRVLRHEARMRLGNCESLRAMTFRAIERALKSGKLTDSEAHQLRNQFWYERLRDKRVAAGAA